MVDNYELTITNFAVISSCIVGDVSMTICCRDAYTDLRVGDYVDIFYKTYCGSCSEFEQLQFITRGEVIDIKHIVFSSISCDMLPDIISIHDYELDMQRNCYYFDKDDVVMLVYFKIS